MSIRLNLGPWSNVFAVPMEIITKHIKLCSGNQFKFIIWFLSNPEKDYNIVTISQELGIPQTEVEEALEYWEEVGIIKINENEVSAVKKVEDLPVISEVKKPEPMRKMLRPDSIYIANRIREDETLANVFSDAQSILGKMLSPSLSAIILIAHDDYCLPCEVIIMLLTYCASIEQSSTSYIERLVKDWYSQGVNTLELAEQKINELDNTQKMWKKLSSIMGIPQRKPSKKETELIIYLIETQFSDEMIKLAYEKCVDSTGKINTKYMTKIFNTWQEKNLTSVQQVEKIEAQYAQESFFKDGRKESSYDISEFDKLSVFSLEEDN